MVLDTNVWVSGLIYGGGAEALIVTALSHHEVICSDYIVDELIECIQRVVPKAPRRWLRMTRLQLEAYCVSVEIAEPGSIRDPKDEPIVALAAATKSIIVTGDKDFLEHQGDLGVPVISVQDALQLLA